MVRRSICRFLLLIGAYHLLHTLIVYGTGTISYPIFSLVKDVLRLGIVFFAGIRYRSTLVVFFRTRRKEVFVFILLLLRAVGLSRAQGRGVSLILVGMKYDLYPLFLVLSGIFLGMAGKWQFTEKNTISSWTKRYRLLIIWGLLRQLLKILRPEFLSLRGYGPVGDYVLGEAPPLYYRTWPGGMMRLQGLFAGPNNYGFFLVGVTSLLGFSLWKTKGRWQRLLLAGLFVLSVWRTVSRGAWVGALVQIAIGFLRVYPRLRRWVVGGGVLALGGLIIASILKWGSTLGHLQALLDGRYAFVAQPWWYGLGMAWPSIHRQGVYLPENHYLQLLLDIGIAGFVLRMLFGVLIIRSVRQIVQSSEKESVMPLVLMSLWVIGLLAEGLFLHVFEDSMVNYLVLVPFGIFLGASMLDSLQKR